MIDLSPDRTVSLGKTMSESRQMVSPSAAFVNAAPIVLRGALSSPAAESSPLPDTYITVPLLVPLLVPGAAAASAAVGSMVMSRLTVNSHDNNFVFTLNAPLHIVIPAKARPLRQYPDRFLILRGSSFVRRIDAVLSPFCARAVTRCQKVYFSAAQLLIIFLYYSTVDSV